MKFKAQNKPGHYAHSRVDYIPYQIATDAKPTAKAAIQAFFDSLIGSPARPRQVLLRSWDDDGMKFPDRVLTISEARKIAVGRADENDGIKNQVDAAWEARNE